MSGAQCGAIALRVVVSGWGTKSVAHGDEPEQEGSHWDLIFPKFGVKEWGVELRTVGLQIAVISGLSLYNCRENHVSEVYWFVGTQLWVFSKIPASSNVPEVSWHVIPYVSLMACMTWHARGCTTDYLRVVYVFSQAVFPREENPLLAQWGCFISPGH